MSKIREILNKIKITGSKTPGLLRRAFHRTMIAVGVLSIILLGLYFSLIPRYSVQASPLRDIPPDAPACIADYTAPDDDGSFAVNTESGFEWLSDLDEETAESDSSAKGLNRITMMSQYVIRYVDNDNRIYTAASQTASLTVYGEAASSDENIKAYRVDYHFTTGKASEGLEIVLPVRYEFRLGSLRVSILNDEVKENDDYKLLQISVLPYFGAAQENDEGYIFIPDGSGAIISFDDISGRSAEWDQMVYGRDPSLKIKMRTTESETVRLPVFGINRGQSAILAIIENGDTHASITARSGGMVSDWYHIFPTFRYREYDTITLNEMGWNERSIPYLSDRKNTSDPFTVIYYFLEGDLANYAGMASVHRNYLIARENIKSVPVQSKVPLYVSLAMSVRKIKPVLGLPSDVVAPLTTYNDVRNIAENFTECGVEDLRIKLDGWQSGGPKSKISSKISFERVLGGRKNFSRLTQWASATPSVSLYPAVQFTDSYANGNGFISLLQGNRDITGALSLQYDFLKSTGTKNLRQSPWYLVTPSFSLGLLSDFLENYGRFPAGGPEGLAIDEYGSKVYADMYDSILNKIAARTPVDRQSASALWQEGMDIASETAGELMMSGGNQYVIGHTDHILGIPMGSSSYKISSMTIPYYQILTTGLVNTASTPVNFSTDPEVFLLKCLETGVTPMYSLMGTESSMVKNTSLNYLYNGYYSEWTDTAVKYYMLYKDVYSQITGALITGHEILPDDQTVTYFDNGKVLTIDHSKKLYTLADTQEAGK